MSRILITGGASAKALSLLKAFPDATIFLADYGEMPAVTMKSVQFISLGNKNPDTAAHNLLKTCIDEQIDILLPLYDFEVAAVSISVLLFTEFNILPLVPSPSWFTGNHAQALATKEWVVLNAGRGLYPETNTDTYPDLTGVFYVNAVGEPIKLFTLWAYNSTYY